MAKTIEAVYEGGTFKPLGPVDLREGQHVHIQLEDEDSIRKRAEENLVLAASVYEGLTEKEIAEIERIALDRSGWLRD